MNEQEYMIECMAKDLVLLLMERRNWILKQHYIHCILPIRMLS